MRRVRPERSCFEESWTASASPGSAPMLPFLYCSESSQRTGPRQWIGWRRARRPVPGGVRRSVRGRQPRDPRVRRTAQLPAQRTWLRAWVDPSSSCSDRLTGCLDDGDGLKDLLGQGCVIAGKARGVPAEQLVALAGLRSASQAPQPFVPSLDLAFLELVRQKSMSTHVNCGGFEVSDAGGEDGSDSLQRFIQCFADAVTQPGTPLPYSEQHDPEQGQRRVGGAGIGEALGYGDQAVKRGLVRSSRDDQVVGCVEDEVLDDWLPWWRVNEHQVVVRMCRLVRSHLCQGSAEPAEVFTARLARDVGGREVKQGRPTRNAVEVGPNVTKRGQYGSVLDRHGEVGTIGCLVSQ